MGKATLVVMAAGIGSRFGGGIKQLEPVGPNGEIIMDYSIADALEVGFDKIVFVIRKDLEDDFKEVIGNRIAKRVEVAYAYQEKSDVPRKYTGMFPDRKKPWGTGQAILVCRDLVKEPFLVINADDYYGKMAYKEAYEYLIGPAKEEARMQLGMVGFVLKNTLSEFGGVTRGVCNVNKAGMLVNIVETSNIEKMGVDAGVRMGEEVKRIDSESSVSMNMWILHPEFFEVLETKFAMFLEMEKGVAEEREFLLPTLIGELLQEKVVDVKVLQSNDKWFGVTYKEDKESVINEIQNLIQSGTYPEKLF